ncbi:hypothetical protein [Halodesulfovibrio marinisediminis]|uniref:Uncharacterized protein n=1 Tax=Halodesulfovibrio marinisediminis DSM 17456 TaxID=1121457 RepID=A0A1N6IWD8_9BACT|nr:hypothetical protein [Halodesulfovibrio marinisediminis]SIO36342.1 hypothetical protein SAMN02745161_3003 [Halodesulfovibrio marinisediminis DSM 17456]
MAVKYHIHTKMMASGDHEVHVEGCDWCPPDDQLCCVGKFETSKQAMESAKKIYPDANGCHHCMPEHYHLP